MFQHRAALRNNRAGPRPSGGTYRNQGEGGVAVIAINPNITLVKRIGRPSGVLSVEARTRSGCSCFVTAVYAPDERSENRPGAPSLAQVLADLKTVTGALPATARGKHVVAGDFNTRIGNVGDWHFTTDAGHQRTDTRSSMLRALMQELQLQPVHGRTADAPASVTSFRINMPRDTVNRRPGPLDDMSGYAEVDYAFAGAHSHVTAAESSDFLWFTPTLEYDGRMGRGPSTHRLISVDLLVTATGDADEPASQRPPSSLPPYSDTEQWTRLGAALLTSLPQLSLDGMTAEQKALAFFDLTSKIASECLTPHKPPAREAAAGAQRPGGNGRRKPANAPLNLKPTLLRLMGEKQRSHVARKKEEKRTQQPAAATEPAPPPTTEQRRPAAEWNHKAKRAVDREYNRQCKKYIKQLGEKLAHLRTADRRSLQKTLDALTSADLSYGGSNGIPDAEGAEPALPRFTKFGRQLYETQAPNPPCVSAPVPQDHTRGTNASNEALAEPIQAAEVYYALFPPHKLVQPPYCTQDPATPECVVCTSLCKEFASWSGKPDDTWPTASLPRVHANRASGPLRDHVAWLEWARTPDTRDLLKLRLMLCDKIADILNTAWIEGQLPDPMLQYRTVPLYKQPKPGQVADPADPDSYRFITISGSLTKTMDTIFTRRITHWAVRNKVVGDTQEGFLPGRSTEHHVLVMLETIKHMHRSGRRVYALFVDLKKAYDKVHPEALAACLRESGVPARLVDLLLDRTKRRRTQLEVNGKASPPIFMRQGVGQGDPLSPILFDIFIQSLSRRLQAAGIAGVKVGDTSVLDLFYADDLAVLVEDPADIQRALDVIHDWCTHYGMEASTGSGKTEAMAFAPPGGTADKPPLHYGPAEIPIHWTEEYRYLGYRLTPNMDGTHLFTEAVERMNRAWARYFLGGGPIIWRSPPALQLDLFNCAVLSSCDYLLSVVPPSDELLKQLDGHINKVSRWVMRTRGPGAPQSMVRDDAHLVNARTVILRDRMRLYQQLQTGHLQRNLLATRVIHELERIDDMAPLGAGMPSSGPLAPWHRLVQQDFERAARAYGVHTSVLRGTDKRLSAYTPRDLKLYRQQLMLHLTQAMAEGSKPTSSRPPCADPDIPAHPPAAHAVALRGESISHKLNLTGRLSALSEGGPSSFGSLTALVSCSRVSNDGLFAVARCRTGRTGLWMHPIAPKCTSWSRSKKLYNQVRKATTCPLCHGDLSPTHVLLECEGDNQLVAQRSQFLSVVPHLLGKLARLCTYAQQAHIHQPRPGELLKEDSQAVVDAAVQRTQRLVAAAHPKELAFIAQHILLMTPWSRNHVSQLQLLQDRGQIRLSSADLAAYLGTIFDNTIVPNNRLRPIANMWARVATASLLRITQTWAAGVDKLHATDPAAFSSWLSPAESNATSEL